MDKPVLALAPNGENTVIDGLDPEYKKLALCNFPTPVGETDRLVHQVEMMQRYSVMLFAQSWKGHRYPFGEKVLESNGSSSQSIYLWEHLPYMAGGVLIRRR